MKKIQQSTATLAVAAVAFTVMGVTSQSAFAENKPAPQPQTGQQSEKQQQAWLGVALTSVPEVLSKQLGNLIPAGQGVMVQSVSANSPAASAGFKDYDIILSMGDQKLYSAKQLAGLVRAAKPESNVTFKVVQQGQLKEMPVTLGKRALPSVSQNWKSYWPMMRHPVNPMVPANPMTSVPPPSYKNNNKQQVLAWDSFESVMVNTLPDGRYHAEISYKDPKGKVKKFTFEGKRDEIINQVNQQKDIPQERKAAILNALNMKPGAVFNEPFFNQPFFNEPFFNQPFFRGNPFNNPFFRNGFGPSPYYHRSIPMRPKSNPFTPALPEINSQGKIL